MASLEKQATFQIEKWCTDKALSCLIKTNVVPEYLKLIIFYEKLVLVSVFFYFSFGRQISLNKMFSTLFFQIQVVKKSAQV